MAVLAPELCLCAPPEILLTHFWVLVLAVLTINEVITQRLPGNATPLWTGEIIPTKISTVKVSNVIALLRLVQTEHLIGAPLVVVAVVVAVTEVLLVDTPIHPQFIQQLTRERLPHAADRRSTVHLVLAAFSAVTEPIAVIGLPKATPISAPEAVIARFCAIGLI